MQLQASAPSAAAVLSIVLSAMLAACGSQEGTTEEQLDATAVSINLDSVGNDGQDQYDPGSTREVEEPADPVQLAGDNPDDEQSDLSGDAGPSAGESKAPADDDAGSDDPSDLSGDAGPSGGESGAPTDDDAGSDGPPACDDPGAHWSRIIFWQPPISREQGVTLAASEVHAYRILYGESPGDYYEDIVISSDHNQYELQGLRCDSVHVTLTAIDHDGRESLYSEEILIHRYQ